MKCIVISLYNYSTPNIVIVDHTRVHLDITVLRDRDHRLLVLKVPLMLWRGEAV